MRSRWRFGIIAGAILSLFSLYPQASLIYNRGAEWNGHYAYNDIDEVAYAAYLNALIDARPRKNDPYTGRDDSPEARLPESLFSIQFAAPYFIALPARILGLSVPLVMNLAGAAAAFLLGLVLYRMFAHIIANEWAAFAGTLFVAVAGALIAGEGAVQELISGTIAYPFFPGLRRYVPALGIPVFFLFIGLVMRLADDASGIGPSGRRRTLSIGSAVVCFAFLVYSYFYLWTAAATWFAIFACVSLAANGLDHKRVANFAVLSAGMAVAAVPFFLLLAGRSAEMDTTQLLVSTRAPDLWRTTELIGFLIAAIIAAGILTKAFSRRDPAVSLAVSLALVPAATLNQQVITGYSLQPIHYEIFVGNYAVGAALVLTIACLAGEIFQKRPNAVRLIAAGAAAAFVIWGGIECFYTGRVLDVPNIRRDAAYPALKELRTLSEREPDAHRQTVFAIDQAIADDLPSIAPQNVLWARHQSIVGSLTAAESERRFFLYAYYLGLDGPALDHYIRTDKTAVIALFGWGRHSARLSDDAKPLTEQEIAAAVGRYDLFADNFSISDAADPAISYVLVPNNMMLDLGRLTRWYDLTEGRVMGSTTLYRARLRDDSLAVADR